MAIYSSALVKILYVGDIFVSFSKNIIDGDDCKAPHCPFIGEFGKDSMFIIGRKATSAEVKAVEDTGIAGVYREKNEEAVIIDKRLFHAAALAAGYTRTAEVENTTV